MPFNFKSQKRFFKRVFLVLSFILVLANIEFFYCYLKEDSNPGLGIQSELIQISNKESLLNDDVISKMVETYTKFAGIIDPIKNKGKRLLFAFSSDIDMVVNGTEFLNYLGCMPIYPHKYQTNLFNKEQICETILFYFTRGLGAEFYVQNGQEFKELIKIARNIQKRQDLGGNSASMAFRGFKEGADVYLNSKMNNHYHQKLFNNSITIVPNEYLEEIRDVHLVIDFNEGETYRNLPSCPRTNRLFLQSDRDNIFPKLDKLAAEITLIKPHVVAVGGFQLLNHQPLTVIQKTIIELKKSMAQINQEQPQVKFHFEMGAFSDSELMQQILTNIFFDFHSIGLNEQELELLMKFVLTHAISDSDVEQDDLSTNTLIKNVIKLIDYMTNQQQSKWERVHFHSSNFQMICSNNNWNDQKFALVRSILVGYTQATKKDNDNHVDQISFSPNTELQYVNSFPVTLKRIFNHKFAQKTISYHELKPENLTMDDLVKCWQATSQMKCCIAPSILHRAPARTCGLGDNIAATSLLYQIKQSVDY